ncbi:coiled-coil-helix-coiled-coil-helix domain-containing protein 5 isoform X1 [Perca flavescens]|uniref:coiled-coil-helix-coiled-coil-helix domain-containing protein 5 isoform X1 n=1 Tax=Perca flavescens TaxID=8167 RepID=UPI00106DDE26|nr:coiled-coil-helix-coiled-coil-helix domain-containing protein 5 isoform X1 [Perca flavescens]
MYVLKSREVTYRYRQAAMDITAKYCHKEMEAYGSCVASNPSTWQLKCHELKIKVAQCTSSHPVIQKIRQDCSSEFVEFERCLRENQDKPTSCSQHVARFLGCAETVDLSGVDPVPQPS